MSISQLLFTVGAVPGTYNLAGNPLNSVPVIPGSVSIQVTTVTNGIQTITDNGAGVLTNPLALSAPGTVNYTTGVMSGNTLSLIAFSAVNANYTVSDFVITGAATQFSITNPAQITMSQGGFSGIVPYPSPGYFKPTVDSYPTVNIEVTLSYTGTITPPAVISAEATSPSAQGINWTQNVLPTTVLPGETLTLATIGAALGSYVFGGPPLPKWLPVSPNTVEIGVATAYNGTQVINDDISPFPGYGYLTNPEALVSPLMILHIVGGVPATYNLSNKPLIYGRPIIPGSISISVDFGGNQTITDNGSGVLSGTGGSLPLGGTVNYTTGALTGITAALAALSLVTAAYSTNSELDSNVPGGIIKYSNGVMIGTTVALVPASTVVMSYSSISPNAPLDLIFTITAEITPTMQPNANVNQNYLATVTDNSGRTQVFNIASLSFFTGGSLQINSAEGYPSAEAYSPPGYPDPAVISTTPGPPIFGDPIHYPSFIATAISSTAVNLLWGTPANPGSTDISGYRIIREAPTGSGFHILINNTASASTSITDTTVLPGVSYNYKIIAINNIGLGVPSLPSGVTTPLSIPTPPLNLTAAAHIAPSVISGQIDLAWTLPTNNGGSPVTGYEIYRESPVGGGFSVLVANTGTTITTYSDTGLTTGAQYNYKVQAINFVGNSADSNQSAAIAP